MSNLLITPETINNFSAYLSQNEKSQNTIEKYIRDVKELAKYSENKPITKELVISYKSYLIGARYTPRSINSMLAAINSFFVFSGHNELKIHFIKILKEIFRSDEKELTKEEFKRLCETAESQGNERLSLIIQTICATGIRVSELNFITTEAAEEGEAIVSLKGKTRVVFIVKKLRKKLLDYAKKNKTKTGPIFVTKTCKNISRCNIWKDMKSLCFYANINPAKVYPHNLRHLFARTFYDIDKDIAKLADILGHSSIETTRIYIMSTGNEHKKKMEKMNLIE